MKELTKEQQIELDEIFASDLLDIETEKKEVEALGQNYENLIKFGQELAKKIK